MTDRHSLRQTYLLQRKVFSPEYKRDADEKIANAVLRSALFQSAKRLFCYVSLPDEVDTRRIITEAFQCGKTVAVPKCDIKKRTMTFHIITGEADLHPGNYGIMEPDTSCPILRPEPEDLCIVPALAVDKFRTRLGYGGGYYDRYLAENPVHTMALTYILAEKLPVEPWDIPMECVVTSIGEV